MKHQSDIERGAHEAGRQSFLGNSGGAPASGLSQGRGSLLRRVSVFGAAGAIVVALFGLLGYVPGLGLLGSVREGYIPMAPSTAISFIVLGGILLAMALRSPSPASLVLAGALAALVTLFGTMEVAGHFTGRDLNFEDALVPSAGYLGEIPIARMSPYTGALFLLAGLAVIALVFRRRRTHGLGTHLGHWGGSLGSLVLGIGFLFLLAYLLGSPLLYGQGATVPMALTTALAFLVLGAATVGASGQEAIPLSLLAGARRASGSMGARRRFLFLTLIMAGACAVVLVVAMAMLYRHNILEHRQQLQTTVQSQARLIEAVARHDFVYEKNTPGGPEEATLSQIMDAHDRYLEFGETGEFTLARRDGDNIVFILRHRHDTVERPEPVVFDSALAEPMRRALRGLSGTVIGLDYRGETVLAAHEPIAVLNLGIVAKIDLAEIRAPFIRSGLAASAVSLLVVLAGMALFLWIGNPIIVRLEAYSRDLEKEVEERKQAEEGLRRSEKRLQLSIQNMPIAFIVWDTEWRVMEWNNEAENIFGFTKAEVLGSSVLDRIVPEAARPMVADLMQGFKEGQSVNFSESNNNVRKDGELISCRWNNTPLSNERGDVFAVLAMAEDVTERLATEEELAKYREHLEELVEERTAQLEDANKELEAFAYSVSHDLRAPLRAIDGFSQVLLEDYREVIDEEGKGYLDRVRAGTQRMGRLIDDLLQLSRLSRSEMRYETVDLSAIAEKTAGELGKSDPERAVEFAIAPGLTGRGDAALLRVVLGNLLGNAWKFTAQNDCARIELGVESKEGEMAYFIRDNGAGFDMAYSDKLFGAFQRLHGESEFPGEGIGLATVQRIIHRHGGRVWGTGVVDEGATFHFTLQSGTSDT